MMMRRRAFTLVELLVVIGIIGLLVSLLLPALGMANERARRVACLAKLRDIGMAGQLHASEHRGHLPPAGWHWNPVGGVANPQGLEDKDERHAKYYLDAGVKRPLPITAALGHYLGVTVRTDSRANLALDLAQQPLKDRFCCPSQFTELSGWSERGDANGAWISPLEHSGYAFNEALLGRQPAPNTDVYPRARLSKVRQPSKVFFALDGRPRDPWDNRYFLVFPTSDDATLKHFQQTMLVTEHGRELIDFPRHGGRINVVFCDGHAESFRAGNPPDGAGGDLEEIYVSRGLF